MGATNAQRMLGPEGWIPTAKEAHEAGFVQEVASHDDLMDKAQARAEQWVKDKKIRSLMEQNRVQEYKDVNMQESHALADAFLAAPFLDAQYKFLKSKGKTQLANTFWFLKASRPLWSKLLK
jgi:peroxisomal 3,2-trans-enoyl-CoA isomerase